MHGELAAKKNFVNTMLRLGKERDALSIVHDQRCTPTYVVDLARAIDYLLTTTEYGLYHVVNGGDASWFEFANAIFAAVGARMRSLPIRSDDVKAALRT